MAKPEWVALANDVSFTPLCRCTSSAYSEVLLRLSDALLAPYGFPDSFFRGVSTFEMHAKPLWTDRLAADYDSETK